MPHIADSEDPGDSGLQREAGASFRPRAGQLRLRAGEDVPVGIACHIDLQSRRRRSGADEDEHVSHAELLQHVTVTDCDRFQTVAAVCFHDLRGQQHVDTGVMLDLVHQVSGHSRSQVRGAHHKVHTGGRAGKEQRGLAGGVAATDNSDRCVYAHPRFLRCCRVEHVQGLEPVQPRGGKRTVSHPVGKDHHI